MYGEVAANGATRMRRWADNFTTALTAMLLRLRIVLLQHYVPPGVPAVRPIWVVSECLQLALQRIAGRHPSLRKLGDGIAFIAFHRYECVAGPTVAGTGNHYTPLFAVQPEEGEVTDEVVLSRCVANATPAFATGEVLEDSDDE
eukprot:GHVU01158047.1.p1 GENE.GHVU01158047.1~~GHVU01158047.1.p1  ORF type:complete len:144 (-),score=13.87 GHVU01158047.1:346-777(-)